MKKLKENKGITLVALIITIIVLLILAVVAINSVQEGGLLAHAKNAQQTYKEAAENETAKLSDYSQYLAEESEKAKIENSSNEGNKKVKIYLDYVYEGETTPYETHVFETTKGITWEAFINSSDNLVQYPATTQLPNGQINGFRKIKLGYNLETNLIKCEDMINIAGQIFDIDEPKDIRLDTIISSDIHLISYSL